MRPTRLSLAIAVLGCACHREERFESVCQVVSQNVVEVDEHGEPIQIDMQLEWDPCPGDQFQMIRGGKEFAKCMKKHAAGDFVPVKVSHFWDTHGYYDWDIYEVDGCARPIELDSPGSFEKSQECHPTAEFGRINGFQCNLRPLAKLVDVCPWTARD